MKNRKWILWYTSIAKLTRTDKNMASPYSTGKPLCPKERTDRESQISGFRFNLVILLGVLILWISRETQNLFLGLDFPKEILICPSEALQQRHYSVNYSQAMQYTTCNLLQFQVRAFPSFRLQ